MQIPRNKYTGIGNAMFSNRQHARKPSPIKIVIIIPEGSFVLKINVVKRIVSYCKVFVGYCHRVLSCCASYSDKGLLPSPK